MKPTIDPKAWEKCSPEMDDIAGGPCWIKKDSKMQYNVGARWVYKIESRPELNFIFIRPSDDVDFHEAAKRIRNWLDNESNGTDNREDTAEEGREAAP